MAIGGLNFTAIDFETANSSRASACAVGAVRVRDGRIVETSSTLIRPPAGHDHFDPINSRIHGIRPEDLEGQPSAAEALADLIDFAGSDVLVAHNARFDLGILRNTCAATGVPIPAARFVCTMTMARRLLELPSYRLPFIADALGVEAGQHHDAGDDAATSARIAVALAHRCQAATLEELTDVSRSHLGVLQQTPGADRSTDLDPDNPLYGKVVCFTGALLSYSRNEAHEAVLAIGGQPGKNVTKETNVLVVGDLDPRKFRPGDTLTSKAQKAFRLREEGQEIEVMAEDDFLRCL